MWDVGVVEGDEFEMKERWRDDGFRGVREVGD